MSGYFCSRCGWHPCRCTTTLEAIGWRELERRRLARDPSIRRVSWVCQHAIGDHSHDYNGVGLRRVLEVAA